MEDYLNSRSMVGFDDETRSIRAHTNALLKRIHEPLPPRSRKPLLSYTPTYDVDPPMRITSDAYIQRMLGPVRSVQNEVEAISYYPEPAKQFIGKGHLACLSFAGGRAIPKRRNLAWRRDEDRHIKDEVNFLSHYDRMRTAALGPHVPDGYVNEAPGGLYYLSHSLNRYSSRNSGPTLSAEYVPSKSVVDDRYFSSKVARAEIKEEREKAKSRVKVERGAEGGRKEEEEEKRRLAEEEERARKMEERRKEAERKEMERLREEEEKKRKEAEEEERKRKEEEERKRKEEEEERKRIEEEERKKKAEEKKRKEEERKKKEEEEERKRIEEEERKKKEEEEERKRVEEEERKRKEEEEERKRIEEEERKRKEEEEERMRIEEEERKRKEEEEERMRIEEEERKKEEEKVEPESAEVADGGEPVEEGGEEKVEEAEKVEEEEKIEEPEKVEEEEKVEQAEPLVEEPTSPEEKPSNEGEDGGPTFEEVTETPEEETPKKSVDVTPEFSTEEANHVGE